MTQEEKQHSHIDVNKMVDEFAHTEVKGYGVPSMIEADAYRKGIEDVLEKQGKKTQGKSAPEAIKEEKVDNQNCVKTVNDTDEEIVKTVKDMSVLDMVESKFHPQDWVVLYPSEIEVNRKVVQISRVERGQSNMYWTTEGTWFDDGTDARIWTLKDAKRGDVLASNSSVFLFQREYNAGKPTAYCGIVNGCFIQGQGACWTNEQCYPATKEQSDILFAKIQEAGYEWDSEKKVFNTIHAIDEGKAEIDYCFTKMMNGEKVSSTWSEEDFSYIDELTDFFEHCGEIHQPQVNVVKWLKSLKERIGCEGYYTTMKNE